MTIHGNLVSNGGGDPASVRNFPIKDDTVDGNVIIQGWHGFWFGIIRVNVGGNVIVANTSGTQVGLPGTEFEGILDSTEVVSNVIGGNLNCHGSTPPAQIGDAILDEGNGPNTVGGNALGACAGVSRNSKRGDSQRLWEGPLRRAFSVRRNASSAHPPRARAPRSASSSRAAARRHGPPR
jgi:hypothetical protein